MLEADGKTIALSSPKMAEVVEYYKELYAGAMEPEVRRVDPGGRRLQPSDVAPLGVDGCTRMQALLRIVLPVAAPGLVSALLFAFTLSWNEFIYALTFTAAADQKTIAVGVTSDLIRGDIYYWGSLMAGAVLGSVPIVVLYVFFLDYYVSGLTAGAVK